MEFGLICIRLQTMKSQCQLRHEMLTGFCITYCWLNSKLSSNT